MMIGFSMVSTAWPWCLGFPLGNGRTGSRWRLVGYQAATVVNLRVRFVDARFEALRLGPMSAGLLETPGAIVNFGHKVHGALKIWQHGPLAIVGNCLFQQARCFL